MRRSRSADVGFCRASWKAGRVRGTTTLTVGGAGGGGAVGAAEGPGAGPVWEVEPPGSPDDGHGDEGHAGSGNTEVALPRRTGLQGSPGGT